MEAEEEGMLATGDSVPDFDVRTVDGARVSYATLWQRRNVLLVSLPAGDAPVNDAYVRSLSPRMPELTAFDTMCVITSDPIRGLDAPGVVVADRWGEIHHVAVAATADGLPGADELIEWLRYVQYECPECQGEAR